MVINMASSIACVRRRLPPGIGAWARSVIPLMIALALMVPAAHGYQAAKALLTSQAKSEPQKPPEPPSPAPGAVPPIPLPEIANRAGALDALLREVSSELTPTPELQAAETAINLQAKEIDQRRLLVSDLLETMPGAMEIQEEDRYWSALGRQYSSHRKLLTDRAASLEARIRVLAEQKAQWQATFDQIHDDKGIEAVVERVREALQSIENSRAQIQAELNRILTLQTQVSQQEKQITEVMGRLSEARERMRGRILQRDGRPLWEVRGQEPFDQSLSAVAYRSANRSMMGIAEFLRTRKLRLAVIVLLYFFALFLALTFKRNLRAGIPLEAPPEASRIFSRPYSVALVIALLGTAGLPLTAPSGVLFFVYLLYSAQMMRLIPLLTKPRVLRVLYALSAFCLLQGVYLAVQVSPLLRRELFVLLVLAALITFAWLVRPSALRQWQPADRKMSVTVAGIRAGFLLLAISLVANVFGYVSLALLLGSAALLAAFAAIILYGIVRVLTLMLLLGLRTWALALSSGQRQALERWGARALALAGSLLWLNTFLFLLAVRDDVLSAISSALRYSIGTEKVHVSLGAVLSFLLILLVGYGLANLVRFVLGEALLARLRLQRGVPHAISTIVYYLLLVLVFVAALADAGVELNKFTLITGALGIGVGFGLQNMVNNFVSGLILLFERPIRVGDTVEVSGVIGTVLRIGVRSSTIQTAQDAEVIVPNSNFISNQVTNWTLSIPRRRVDLPVGVAYGTDPEPVVKLLVEVAASFPGVLREPAPAAFFLGFGDSALNFELRFWSDHETWFQLKSDVAIGVARALRDARIEVPFPQRDLHLRSIDGEARAALHLAPPRPAPVEDDKPIRAARSGRTKG